MDEQINYKIRTLVEKDIHVFLGGVQKGYVVECEQKQQANRLRLTNYKMKKNIK